MNAPKPTAKDWALRLFKLSLLKQAKLRALCDLLGPTEGLHCLDIGGDNGVISLLLRERGGTWTSADGSAKSVEAIRSLVGGEVCMMDGARLPLPANRFDRVVVIDYLEHVIADDVFISECHRVLKKDGVLIVNTPHIKRSLIFTLRRWLNLSDANHGHVRPGYTESDLFAVLRSGFELETVQTYSRFFAQLLDTAIRYVSERKGASHDTVKGTMLTEEDFARMEKSLKLYKRLYPIFWFAVQLDRLLFRASGFMIIARAKRRAALKQLDLPILADGRSLATATLDSSAKPRAKKN